MLTIEGLSKSFGGVAAMNDVSLHFPEGSLTAVIGPNGAGKTTFFNLITGAFRPDTGRILLFGEDIAGLTRAAGRAPWNRAGIPDREYLSFADGVGSGARRSERASTLVCEARAAVSAGASEAAGE